MQRFPLTRNLRFVRFGSAEAGCDVKGGQNICDVIDAFFVTSADVGQQLYILFYATDSQ